MDADGAAAFDTGDLDAADVNPEEGTSSRGGGAGPATAGGRIEGVMHLPDLQAVESDESL